MEADVQKLSGVLSLQGDALSQALKAHARRSHVKNVQDMSVDTSRRPSQAGLSTSREVWSSQELPAALTAQLEERSDETFSALRSPERSWSLLWRSEG